MNNKIFGLISVAVLSLALSPANAGETTVVQKDKEFRPGDVSVKVGDTIRFENQDRIMHNVYSRTDGHKFSTKGHKPGETIVLKFDKAGLIDIRCALHPKMKMNVTVEN